jgi:hypothetical protein
MYRLGIILIIATAVMSANAQSNLSSTQIDSLTYQQYLNKDYKNLIETSKAAREQNIDFYYLNYRTAIAYYELKNYAKAAEFYKKTLSETPDDPILRESLYYAYLLSGQKENAAITAETLPPHTLATIGYKPSAVDFVSLSGGYMINDNKPDILSRLSGYDSLNQYQDMIYTSLTLGLNLSARSKLKLGYQLYSTNFEQYNKNGLVQTDKLKQHQLVAALEILTKNNISLGVAGGYYNIQIFDNSAIYSRSNGYGFGPGNASRASMNSGKTVSAFSALAFLNKRFTYVQPEIAVAYSNFGNGSQYQGEGSLTYYPLGNLDFYGQTKFAAIYSPNAWKEKQFVFSQSLGVKLAKPLWLDGSVSFGNHLNYITERSFLVYDTYNPINAIAAMSLSYYFKKAMISVGYQWQQREGYAYSTIDYITYKYNNHLFNIALLWDF